MLLKPRVAINVAMVFGGLTISLVGFGSALIIGSYASIVPLIIGILGLGWIAIGTLTLIQRSRRAVIIDEAGITVPIGTAFQRECRSALIPRKFIARISKRESFKGRLIEITLRTGGKVSLQARHYCGLKEFLSHCKHYGLPVT
jgi:hypothetical protein